MRMRTFPGSHHHHVVRRGELAAEDSYQAPGRQAKQQQDHPGIDREEEQERTAQVQSKNILEDDEAEGSVTALPRRIAQDDAWMSGVEFLVDFQPESDGHPGEQRKRQDQRLLVHRQEEDPFEVQDDARPVGGLERQRGQDDVR